MSVNSFSGQPAIPASYGFTAGKNKIINGDFGIWQRGTSGTSAAYGVYAAPDRFAFSSIGGTSTITRQTFTPGSAPVAGYEGTYYCQVAPGTGTTYIDFGQAIEDVRVFAGQTVTFSFWAKATSSITLTPSLYQNFGSGGSTVVQSTGSNFTLTSSWVRYSATINVPSIAGKTIGTNSCLSAYFITASGTVAGNTISFWGVQLEAGATATSFQTATGTIQGELAACQRYYQRWGAQVTGGNPAMTPYGSAASTTNCVIFVPTRVPMRTTPTSLDYGGTLTIYDGVNTQTASAAALSNASADYVLLSFTGTGLTQYRPYAIYSGATNAYLGLNAEL